jgi:acetyl-CoA carboxylase carboxyltransferase component/biotin carboxyl carrier protein
MAEQVGYDSLGTFEFLVGAGEDGPAFAFIEANARLQVEHTVTEELTGVDLVQAQLRIAGGETLDDLGLAQTDVTAGRGFAMQVRVNTETMDATGATRPTGGTITAFEVPTGPGVRTDTAAYAGSTTNPRYDSLLAKVIVRSRSDRYADVVAKAERALAELRVEGVATNVSFLRRLLRHPAFVADEVHTGFVDEHAAELGGDDDTGPAQADGGPPIGTRRAGATVDARDPLAVLVHGKEAVGGSAQDLGPAAGSDALAGPDGTSAVAAPMQGTVVSVDVAEGDLVAAGQQLLVMEAMKMEHVIRTDVSGLVRAVGVVAGDTVFEGHPLLHLEQREVEAGGAVDAEEVDLDDVRPDLAEVHERQAKTSDAARPDAVARRRATGQRTTRENVADLVDPGTFVEYGALVVAAQRRRRSMEDLIDRTPADGMVAGIGAVNGDLFDEATAQCVVTSYDYTVLAGTQGLQNHRKKDRMFELAEANRLPVVLFAEGGGGRPGDTDGLGAAGLDCMAFTLFGRLSGLVPLVGITSGRCFAGNAALLGCCDVIIATAGSNIGMGGPAMIEGGGLGVFRPEEVGPMSVQVPNGVVDIAVADEAEAVAAAKRYLSYFQGPVEAWECADQRLLRRLIPENRLRVYDIREVVDTLADSGSVLELRRGFGAGMVTSLIRIEGRPMGLIANNPAHLGGAIDSDGADKAARFMQLCDAFDLPILCLCDTPGMMVGPEVERTALVRHCSRMFVTGANVSVPLLTIVLRKAYGLGAQTMAAGSFKAPFFTVSWPTGEFGGMGLEGFVKLGYRNELAALDDPEERRALYEKMVARLYEQGKALSEATSFEIDDVIDPVDSRHRITMALRSTPPPLRWAGRSRGDKKRPHVDTW